MSRDLPIPASPESSTTWPSLLFASRPAPQQQIEFFFPPNEVRQSGRVHCLEAAFRRTRPQHRPGPRGSGDALEVLCSEVLKLEQIAQELSRAFGDDDAFGSAMPCRRAARFGVSPTTAGSCAAPDPIRSPTTTSPVAMPTRVWRDAGDLSAVTAATASRPARTARSASSSPADSRSTPEHRRP